MECAAICNLQSAMPDQAVAESNPTTGREEEEESGFQYLKQGHLLTDPSLLWLLEECCVVCTLAGGWL
jgi:hypothetical protein